MDSPDTGLQPFQCTHCPRRFTRRENLKRHATVHCETRKSAVIACEYCDGTFSRQDLRIRHVQRKHPGRLERNGLIRRQSNNSRSDRNFEPSLSRDHLGDSQMEDVSLTGTTLPTSNEDFQLDTSAVDDDESNSGFSPATLDHAHTLAIDLPRIRSRGLSHTQTISSSCQSVPSPYSYSTSHGSQTGNAHVYPSSSMYLQDDFSSRPSDLNISLGIRLFFTHVASFLPFIHKATLNATRLPRHLLLSMLCLGYQYSDDPTSDSQRGIPSAAISRRYFDEARNLVAVAEIDDNAGHSDLQIIQSYLLLEVYALLYLCGTSSALGLEMHSRMIALARAKGLMLPVLNNDHGADTEDLDALWHVFVESESQKRTLHAILQIDALWYQLLSVPRSISHLEIKYDLPCSDSSWEAGSASQWAHRQLQNKNNSSSLGYADAVRLFISPEAQAQGVTPPKLDTYGAISVAHFLLSSMREVSGWSSLTGRVSLDRFEPLKTSVIALERSIRSAEDEPMVSNLLCEATWEISMIELHLWSRSHTGGIVQASLDDTLYQWSYQARNGQEFTLCKDTISLCQPHLDWFVRYLDTSSKLSYAAEPPWVLIYAYKAFLVTWELVRRGDVLSETMQTLGLQSGESQGCLQWARGVFHGRPSRRLGELIYQCIDILDD